MTESEALAKKHEEQIRRWCGTNNVTTSSLSLDQLGAKYKLATAFSANKTNKSTPGSRADLAKVADFISPSNPDAAVFVRKNTQNVTCPFCQASFNGNQTKKRAVNKGKKQ